jgi:outer membrane lipoprotein-sorting protein
MFSFMAAFAAFTLACMAPSAQDADLPSADEIVQNVNGRDDGTSLTRTLSITLTDKRGKTRDQVSVAFRKYFDGEKHSAIFYTEPANLKDTAFLTYDYDDYAKSDDQWLYLPELRRVRRISSSNRGDYYLGTDFTYEDMKLDTRLSRADYNWKTTGTEEVNGHKCFVIEGEPKSEEIAKELGYGKYQAWVDPETWLVHQTVVWDENLNQLKTVSWRGWQQVDGLWAVTSMTAENHKTGHTTLFTFSDIDYATEISDDVFTERGIMRGAPHR